MTMLRSVLGLRIWGKRICGIERMGVGISNLGSYRPRSRRYRAAGDGIETRGSPNSEMGLGPENCDHNSRFLVLLHIS